MKTKGSWWLIGGFLVCLLVMPSFVRADVTVSGGTETGMVDLEGINNGTVTPGDYTTVSGTTRNAYVTDTGAVDTGDTAAILTNANGWSVNVSSGGSLTGGNYGVLFDEDGNNPYLNGSLTNYGSIYGGTHGALMNYGTITNYGSLTAGIGSGAIFSSDGTGTATVTNSGTLSGGDNGLEFYNPSAGTMTAMVTNNGSGTISGYYNGIEFYSAGAGTVTVKNSVTITGNNMNGIVMSSDGALTARIQNNVGGDIYGYYNGIVFDSEGAGDVQITNAGTITGEDGNGIYLFSGGTGTFTVNNTGDITAGSDYEAIYIAGFDDDSLSGSGTGTATITNSGTISAYGSGIGIEYLDSATISNAGQIQSSDSAGLYVNNVGDITLNNAGLIQGDYKGISMQDVGDVSITNLGNAMIQANSDAIYIVSDGSDVTITNSAGGKIQSSAYGIGIDIRYPDTATVNNSGSIVSPSYAIYIAEGNAAIVNNYAGGELFSYDDDGIHIENTDTVTVNNYGRIEGYYGDYDGGGIYIGGAETATVNNYAGGQITGFEGEGIYMNSIDTATVTNAGLIYGYMDGIGIEDVHDATVTNSGTILSGYDEYDYAGIYLDGIDKANVTNLAGGFIFGEDDAGIYMTDVNTATVTNAGTIRGYYSGISIYGSAGYSEFVADDDDDLGPSSATVTNSGTIMSDYDGIYIDGMDSAKVTNNAGGVIQSYEGRGIAMKYIGTPAMATAEVVNSGTIQAFGYHDEDGNGDAIYIAYADAAKVTNNTGGLIQSRYGYGVGIIETGAYEETYYDDDDDLMEVRIPGPVDVTNSGTIQAYLGGVGVASAGAVTVTNNEGGIIQGGVGYMGSDDDDDYIPSGVGIIGAETIDVTNKGTITGILAGVGAYEATGGAGQDGEYGTEDDVAATINITNSGTIQGFYTGVSAYGAMGAHAKAIPMDDDDDLDLPGTIDITNSGTIQGEYLGVGAGFADIINVTNEKGGTIELMNIGSGGFGVGIMYGGTATVTNAGEIRGGQDGVGMAYLTEAKVTNSGTIWGIGNGVGIVYVYESATVENSGTIRGVVEGSGVLITNAGLATVNNSGTIEGHYGVYIEAYDASVTNSGTIQGGKYGLYVNNYASDSTTIDNSGTIIGSTGIAAGGGYTTIVNSGTVTGTGGTAISVTDDYNTVTLTTGSVINGIIQADNEYPDNYMVLDGEGTINADQIQQFSYLDKTGAGTWILNGDYDYASDSYDGHTMTVHEGILALGQRGSADGGVQTDYFSQDEGASLGYVVSATGATGALLVSSEADFSDGAIVVIPTAGTYAKETIYENVLNLSSADFTPWGSVVSTSAFLSPEMIDLDEDDIFDLALTRLSFTSGMPESLNGFGSALDEIYDTATGDMRTFLDELLVLSPEDAAAGMASASGGTQSAMQRLSFSGLGNYLGVINNHLGGASFAQNSGSSGMAFTPYTQMALAGGGETLSDATPLLLAAVGNIGQGQIASGTNWGLWIDGYFSYGDRRSDDIITKYNQKLYGGMLGFDFRVTDNLFLGVSGGISTAKLDFDDLADEGKMNSYQGTLYACYNGMPWYAAGIFTFAYNTYDFDRYITFAPGLVAKSDYDGREYLGYGEVGYKFNAGGVIIRPSVAFQVDYLTLDAFTETGAGMYNLTYDENDIGSYQSFLGVNISGPIKLGASAVLTPELRLKWAHEFSNDDNMIKARLAGSGSGSSWWSVEAEDLSRDSAIVGLGLNLKFNRNVAAYIQYDAQINSDLITHTGLVGLRFEW